MVAYRISDDEIINILKEKYISLINDCKLFDSGNLAGIKESCNKIRLLLHDTE